MKTKILVIVLAGFFLSLSASVLSAQSLGELARQEKAKRQSQPKAQKVYTNDNLPKATAMESSGGMTTSAPSPAAETGATETGASEAPAEGAAGAASAAASTPPASGESQEAKPDDKKKTKEYWEAQFRQAYAAVDRAEEELSLANDELTLAQMNQARELDPQKKAQLDQEVSTKLDAADAKRAAAEKAKQALEDLKAQFKESGAPEDWMPKQEEKK